MKKTLLCSTLMFAIAFTPALAAPLPDLGNVGEEALSQADEARIGREILSQIRDAGDVVQDAEVNAYLARLGKRITSAAATGNDFTFFAVDDNSINAFAMPGGVIGVHTGLLLAAQSEGELASVLSHEVAHVTQRHLARMRETSTHSQLWILAAVLAGVLASRSGNSDATFGALNAGMGMAAQTQLAYSRDFEREADRIGMYYLTDAGFDARTMPAFFERLQQGNRYNDNKALSFLRTHPVTSERISEGQDRAQSQPVRMKPDSTDFLLVREKLRLNTLSPADAVPYYQRALADRRFLSEGAQHYGLARAYLAQRNFAAAQQAASDAVRLLPADPMLYTLQAEIALSAGQTQQALAHYRQGLTAFPASRALLLGEVQALIASGQQGVALRQVQALLARHPADAELHRLAARLYGENDALSYHAELGHAFYFEQMFESALVQYRLASAAKGDNFYLRSSVEARMREVEKALKARAAK
ncbi:M48 family peptidase [Rhodobacteraceae bacterium CH30]|nr:M48 family peptidase [Rhodobacteraceae bacterium CH30]